MTSGMSSLLAVIAGAVGLSVLGVAGFSLRRAWARREQLDRELELLLPGTRVGPTITDSRAPVVAGAGPGTPVPRAVVQLREQARDWALRDTQRAALVLAAWAGGALGAAEGQRHGQK